MLDMQESAAHEAAIEIKETYCTSPSTFSNSSNSSTSTSSNHNYNHHNLLNTENNTGANSGLNPHLDVLPIGCNVASEKSVQAAYKHVISHFGQIDAVVASAGIVENYEASEYPAERAKLLFDVNYFGAFYTAREAAKYMIPNGGGSIVLIGSMSADVGYDALFSVFSSLNDSKFS